MKNLITFGIALVALSQVNATTVKSADHEQGESFQTDSLVTEQKHFAPVEDQAVLNPSAIFVVTNKRSIEEVIAEDRRITENNLTDDGELLFIEQSEEEIIAIDRNITDAPNTAEIHPLYLDRTIEDRIAEDSAIIENNGIEAQPLDFTAIENQLIFKKDNSFLLGMN